MQASPHGRDLELAGHAEPIEDAERTGSYGRAPRRLVLRRTVAPGAAPA
jgi:hypothetical protein